jgi:IclR family transcriptional regulator, KDG regulon repressor
MNLETLQRGLDILFLLKDYSMMSVSEISLNLRLPQSSAYRYITNLKERGLVDEREKQGYYGLGPKILELAEGLCEKPSLPDIALSVMRSLQKETGETIVLNIMQGCRIFCIERVESDQELRVSPSRGKARFMHTGASAKVIMAYLSESEQDNIIQKGLPRFTQKTITDPKELKEDLRRIRKNGYSVSAGEFMLGTRGIAAPILSGNGKLIAGLGLIGPSQRVTATKIPRFTKMVVKAAEEIGNRIDRLANLVSADQVFGQDSTQQSSEAQHENAVGGSE